MQEFIHSHDVSLSNAFIKHLEVTALHMRMSRFVLCMNLCLFFCYLGQPFTTGGPSSVSSGLSFSQTKSQNFDPFADLANLRTGLPGNFKKADNQFSLNYMTPNVMIFPKINSANFFNRLNSTIEKSHIPDKFCKPGVQQAL